MDATIEHLFLDTQQWNYLVSHRDATEGDLERWRDRLIADVQSSRLEIVGSLPLMQEVAGTNRRFPSKYVAMRTLMLESIGDRWLLPLNERHPSEFRSSGLLALSNRYLSRSQRRELVKLSRRVEGTRFIADEGHRATEEFKQQQEQIRSGIEAKLTAATGTTDIHKLIDEWWRTVDIDSWVAEIVDEGVARRILDRPGGTVDLRNLLPSVWLFMAFKLARIKLNLGERRSIKSSDYMDAEHCAIGPYIDVLVTDDRAFRDTMLMVPNLPFKLETFADLVSRLESPRPRVVLGNDSSAGS